jgi:beta-lactamase superfamily II metal-dependent hydrolase
VKVDIFDVEAGQCAIIHSPDGLRIAMVDCGHNYDSGWEPSTHLINRLGRTTIDYLFITNADEDHFSHLADLRANRIGITTFVKNWKVSADRIEEIKSRDYDLSADAEEYLRLVREYTGEVSVPFNEGMAGITMATFCCDGFDNTNDLSMAVFFEYCGFKILFPGDLGRPAWLELMKDPSFIHHLNSTTVLVASHHGREDGYCEEIFANWRPRAVVFSDKGIVHESQETSEMYRAKTQDPGVILLNGERNRKVLTTRDDGDIRFTVLNNGDFYVWTGQL